MIVSRVTGVPANSGFVASMPRAMNWRFSTGETADALNPTTKHILELKTSPREMLRGLKQIQRYIKLAEKEISPGPWSGDVVPPR